MAKAKKPASGRKSTTQASKAKASKPDATAADPKVEDAPSKASQAAAAKPDNKVSADSTPAGKKVDAPHGVRKPEPAETKPVAASKADTAKTPESAKPQDAKDQAAAAKSDPKTTARATTKPDQTKSPEPTKADAKVDAKKVTEPAKTEDKPVTKTEAKPAEKVSTPAPVKPPEPQKQRSGFLPLVIGGLIAGGVGFAAAEYNWLSTRPNIEGMQQMLAEQQEQIAALAPADLSGVESGIAEVSEAVAGIDTRLTTLEDRPVVVAGDGNGPSPEYFEQLAEEYAAKSAETYAQELAGLKGIVEEQKDEIARLLDNALSVEEATAASARAATIQAATAKLTAALSSGAAYDTVIDELSAAGIADLPGALTDPAADGVATLSVLQSGFPPAARAGLAAARTAGVDAGTGGVGGFLKRQLGARSVAPREGSDPDAVLSRAEAAVRNGNVGSALSELETLPPEVQSAMEDWLAQARTRAGAEQAVQDLSERLTAN